LPENLVFIELKRRRKKIYYHNKGQECDFVIKEGKEITDAIQVIYVMPNEKERKREVDGLLNALNTYKLPSGLISTADTEEEFIENGKQIKIIPAWKWLLNK
jgi:predicted AAA+ superfamily ATPase